MSTFTLAPSIAFMIRDGKIAEPVNISVISGTKKTGFKLILSPKIEIIPRTITELSIETKIGIEVSPTDSLNFFAGPGFGYIFGKYLYFNLTFEMEALLWK